CDDTLTTFMGILALLTYLYEIPAGACLGELILQTFCLILQISSRNPPFKRSLLEYVLRETCNVIRTRSFDRGKYANRRWFLSYSNSWLASVSLFVAYAAGSRAAVPHPRHRRPGKQADH